MAKLIFAWWIQMKHLRVIVYRESATQKTTRDSIRIGAKVCPKATRANEPRPSNRNIWSAASTFTLLLFPLFSLSSRCKIRARSCNAIYGSFAAARGTLFLQDSTTSCPLLTNNTDYSACLCLFLFLSLFLYADDTQTSRSSVVSDLMCKDCIRLHNID